MKHLNGKGNPRKISGKGVIAAAVGLMGIAAVVNPVAAGAEQGDQTSTDMQSQTIAYAGGVREDAPIPRPGVALQPGSFAVVMTDPQNDFLSPEGATWGVVGKSVTETGTVQHLEDLFKVAAETHTHVFVSPHYYYPHDHGWKLEGALEQLMHDLKMFDRPGALDLGGFEGSGADWLERYKPYFTNDEVIVVSPHKVYGPESNDLALQLRKRGITQIILAGMSANLCTESHLRELVEQGFEVAIVADATAAAQLPGYDGYEAAFVNFRMIASDVWSTNEAVERIRAAGK